MNYDNATMDEVGRRTSSSFLMFSAGLFVGAAAALVMAPTTGRDTRAYLGKRGRQLADTMATRGKQAWNEHGERVAEAMREGYTHAASKLTSKANGSLQPGQGT